MQAVRRILAAGFAVVGIAALLVAGTGMPGAHAQGQAFRIGVAIPLSGPLAPEGRQVQRAYELWKAVVNAEGGIAVNGRRYPVEIIYYDDESSEQQSGQLIEQLITVDNVDLLLGGVGDASVLAASTVAERYGYPYFFGGASADPIFDRGHYFTFGLLNKAFDAVRSAAEVFGQLPGAKTVAVIAGDHLVTQLAAEGFRYFAERAGLEVVHFEIFPMALQDYVSLLLTVRGKKPDVLLVGSLLPQSLQVMRALAAIGWRPKGIAFSHGPTAPDFVAQLGEAAEYVIAASEWLPELPYKDPVFWSARGFAEAFRARYGADPDYVCAAAAAAAIVQQAAVQALGITPPVTAEGRAAIAQWVRENTVQTLYGPVRFAEDGSLLSKGPIAVQIQNGRLVHVYPRLAEQNLDPRPVWYPAPSHF
ncbi:MAG TPA: amino acid ABC transporter substrate-binding protein [Limnochordales bacterium]